MNSLHLKIARCISMSSKCIIVSIIMLSTAVPVTQSCSGSGFITIGMEREKTTAMKEGTSTAALKLVTFPLNVMWGQAALVYQTLEAVTASKDSVSLVGWAKKEKILRFLRRIDALTTPIVNAGDMQFEKNPKEYYIRSLLYNLHPQGRQRQMFLSQRGL